jgi:hypothetical protein
MDQRIEFAMKALRTDNFRALCAEYGISTKTGYKCGIGCCAGAWKGWPSNRADRTVIRSS